MRFRVSDARLSQCLLSRGFDNAQYIHAAIFNLELGMRRRQAPRAVPRLARALPIHTCGRKGRAVEQTHPPEPTCGSLCYPSPAAGRRPCSGALSSPFCTCRYTQCKRWQCQAYLFVLRTCKLSRGWTLQTSGMATSILQTRQAVVQRWTSAPRRRTHSFLLLSHIMRLSCSELLIWE